MTSSSWPDSTQHITTLKDYAWNLNIIMLGVYKPPGHMVLVNSNK